LRLQILSCLLLATITTSAEESQKATSAASSAPSVVAGTVISGIRTTAYTHTEAAHLKYGLRTAAGTHLKHGEIRSAAADWSVFPVGTLFQIAGQSCLYVVDDYGAAVVGTRTIDLYKPSKTEMNRWGTRTVSIRIVRWGSYARSLAILKPRAPKASHVRKMVSRLALRVPA
jgi:3D (Asp-Asp-Asp) domain-containing protein